MSYEAISGLLPLFIVGGIIAIWLVGYLCAGPPPTKEVRAPKGDDGPAPTPRAVDTMFFSERMACALRADKLMDIADEQLAIDQPGKKLARNTQTVGTFFLQAMVERGWTYGRRDSSGWPADEGRIVDKAMAEGKLPRG